MKRREFWAALGAFLAGCTTWALLPDDAPPPPRTTIAPCRTDPPAAAPEPESSAPWPSATITRRDGTLEVLSEDKLRRYIALVRETGGLRPR